MTAVCRIGDHSTGTCTTHSRTFTGTWTQGSDILSADTIGVVRVGDVGVTDCSPPHEIVASVGSGVTTVLGVNIHRVSDAVIVTSGGSGVSTTGSGTSNFG